jgi:phosphate uptake regulator
MEARKVQKAGGSTFTVSLPKKWAEKRLSSSDTVFLDTKENSIEIHVSETGDSKKFRRIQLAPDHLSNVRKMIASYVSGADEIVASAGSEKALREFGMDISDRLIGLEITSNKNGDLKARNLSDISQFSTINVLRRVDGIIREMLDKLVDEDYEKPLGGMEEEVDKLQFLAVRQLHEAVEDTGKMSEMGLESSSECLNLRLVFRDSERISDHLYFISKHSDSPEIERVSEIYRGAMSSYLESDAERAEKVIEESLRLDEELEPSSQLERSIRRVNRLSKDIAETSLNQNFELDTVDSNTL